MIKRYNKEELIELSNILKNNGTISVPTDTVYGVCASINSIEAYNNLIKVKNRPSTKPFPVMCKDLNQIKEIAYTDVFSEKIINKLMPGPLTLILNKKENVPEYVTNGKSTIAIRMATSNELEKLIQYTGSPIFLSSANQSGEDTCTNLDEIEKMCPLLDGMLEGNTTFGQSSTILDCSTNQFKVLRKGPITMSQILNVIDK